MTLPFSRGHALPALSGVYFTFTPMLPINRSNRAG